MIRYISTRGPGDPKNFLDVMMAGLAPDGGLYVPDIWPTIDHDMVRHLSGAPYTLIAATVMSAFIGSSLSPSMLQQILVDTYGGQSFNHPAVAPLTQIGPNAWLLELFHGPTLSFKDYALQLIGRLFDHVLEQKGQKITIVGATSGDTGSAAIEACKGCKNITTFILHPQGRTSEIQRRQMTSIDAPNIHNLAIDGDFDDCQALVKAMLVAPGLRDLNLSAVNSINWARIMAQIVYYFAAAIALGAPGRPVSFTVPTGNFGNVYAGWAARRIGLPIDRLTIASNRNDILTRFFETGAMTAHGVTPSLSPSMDIQVSSNFERYLFDLTGRDPATINRLMSEFRQHKTFSLPADLVRQARSEFSAFRCSDDETLAMMRECYGSTGIVIDPHTATALHAATYGDNDPSVPNIIVATAHPSKFPDAVQQAVGLHPPLPPHLADLLHRPEHYTVLPNDLAKVTAYIRNETKT